MVQEIPQFLNQPIAAGFEETGGKAKSRVKVALFSSGLGSVNRGFEISTARFFRAISERPLVEARLYAGAEYPGARKVWSIGRKQWLRFPLNLLSFLDSQRVWKLAYVLEQISFSFGLITESLNKWQPDVVWTKEVPLAHILREFRRISGRKYKIIFANGGGFRPKTYSCFDFIQHLQPDAYEEALRAGIPAAKMNVLPNMVPPVVAAKSRQQLREDYGFAQDDWIVISVAAWNSHHKRIDYLIEEVAGISDPKCKLIICGEPEPGAAVLQSLAHEKLGDRVRFVTTNERGVHELLLLSDAFALCSLYEGLGAVMIEAALAGIPVLSHPHGGSRYILQDENCFVDMSERGNLTRRLAELRSFPPSESQLIELKREVHERFSESKLSCDFEAMLWKVCHDGEQRSAFGSAEN